MPRSQKLRQLPSIMMASAALATGVPGCSGDRQEPEAAATPEFRTVSRYDWYMEGKTPAGESTVAKTDDGRITNDTFVHWNNREYTVRSEVQLNRDGMIVSQRVTGISPFQAPIDESFRYADGVATWGAVGSGGSARTGEPAFYVSNELGAFESMPALVRAGLQRFDGEIPLIPAGSARVEHVTDLDVETGSGRAPASLYAVSGIDLTPGDVWLDEDRHMLALDRAGYLGMIPQGWDKAVLGRLSEVQTEAAVARAKAIADDLARPMDEPVVFEQVDIVDVESGELLEVRFVKVEDGKIAAISIRPITDARARRIDAGGRTLIPGLWDMHGHFDLEDGVLNIAGGITSVRDIGGVHDKVMEKSARFDSGEIIGPNGYRAGFIDKAGPFASGWAAETLDDALERVDFFAGHGYQQIKLYSSIEPGWVEPIAARAHSHGMRLSGHIPAFMSAEQAVKAGYDEIQHINMVFLNILAGDREDTRKQLRFTLYGDEAANLDLDSARVEQFIALLRENDVVIDPTAAIFDTMLRHVAGEPDPTFAPVIDHLPPAVSRRLYSPEMVLGEAWPASAVKQSAMLRKLYESGVQLVPGSDHMAAFTLHRELEVYVEAGIPNAAVLKMATLDSARVVGVDDRTGSIAVGKDSDLVLLDGNPLADIRAVRRATLVMKGDTIYRPDELYEAVGVKPFVASTDI